MPIVENSRVVGWTMTSHQRLALKAALQGNWKPADTLELQYANAHLRPHYRPDEETDGLEAALRWDATEILRRYGPDCVDAIHWEARPHADRRRRWMMPSEISVITDIDGLILEWEWG